MFLRISMMLQNIILPYQYIYREREIFSYALTSNWVCSALSLMEETHLPWDDSQSEKDSLLPLWQDSYSRKYWNTSNSVPNTDWEFQSLAYCETNFEKIIYWLISCALCQPCFLWSWNFISLREKCPVCHDTFKSPVLSFFKEEDKKILLSCHASTASVYRETNLQVSGLQEEIFEEWPAF